MELIKKTVHMNRPKGTFVSQITLDEDFNLPESKPDIGRIVMEHNDIVLENVQCMDERVEIQGKLNFELLYLVDNSMALESYQGSLSFTELMNCNGVTANDTVRTDYEVEDITISIVNSRKLRVNAVILLKTEAEELYDALLATQADQTGGNTKVSVLQNQLEVMQLKVSQKDIYRIREEVELGNNKPNISRILWKNLDLRGVEIKTAEDKLTLRGELMLFLIYEGEEEHIPLQWMEKSIHFSGEINVNGCAPELIPDIQVCLATKEIEVKPDFDGEMRMLMVDAVLQLNMNLYEEENVTLLSDVYLPSVQLVPEFADAYFDRLVIKNNAKCKINEKVTLKGTSKILQICHSSGEVKLDRCTWVEEGLNLEGGILLQLLYMSTEDNEPLQMIKTAVPFSYTMEVPKQDRFATEAARQQWQEQLQYHVHPGLEQLSTVMLGNDEIEVRAVLSFDAVICQMEKEEVIVSVKEEPLDMTLLENMPGIVGYIVGEHDTLWSIAKQFYTSVETLKTTNGMTTDVLRPGDRLLIIKEVENDMMA